MTGKNGPALWFGVIVAIALLIMGLTVQVEAAGLSSEIQTPSYTEPVEQTTPAYQVVEPSADIPLAPGLAVGIAGITFDEDATNSGYYHIPPDPIGAAGPNHVVSVVNTSIEWHTKGGTQQHSQSLANFFTSLSPATGTFDPKVIYDQYAGRFVVVTLEKTAAPETSVIYVAVSDDSDPNGTWYFHAIDALTDFTGTSAWADYPGLAVDDQAIYITNNLFSFAGVYQDTYLWIIHKGLSGGFYDNGAATVTVHDPNPGDASDVTMQPAHMFGTPPGALGTILVRYSGLSDGTNEYIYFIRVEDPTGTPTFSQQFVNVGDIDNTGAAMPGAPQSGTAETVNTNDRRALNAVWRNNKLYLTATVVPGSGTDTGQATAHWFKFDTSTLTAFTLVDQGNVGGEDIAAGAYTFFPSVAVNKRGDMAIGFAASASTIYPGAYYVYRKSSDAAGTVRAAGTIAAGLDYYVRKFGGSRNRWGDYTGTSVDPADDLSFWVFNEYALAKGTNLGDASDLGRWGTYWGKIQMGTNGSLPAASLLLLD